MRTCGIHILNMSFFSFLLFSLFPPSSSSSTASSSPSFQQFQPKVSLELIEHVSCACASQLANRKRTKRSREPRSANQERQSVITPSSDNNNNNKVVSSSSIPPPETTTETMSGNLTILSNVNYYQTCLACKAQAEICEGCENKNPKDLKK